MWAIDWNDEIKLLQGYFTKINALMQYTLVNILFINIFDHSFLKVLFRGGVLRDEFKKFITMFFFVEAEETLLANFLFKNYSATGFRVHPNNCNQYPIKYIYFSNVVTISHLPLCEQLVKKKLLIRGSLDLVAMKMV